jgi:hypothetical protein
MERLTRADIDAFSLDSSASINLRNAAAAVAAQAGDAEAVFLVRAAESMPRLRRLCEEQSPEPLRRRRLLAPPDFLTAA